MKRIAPRTLSRAEAESIFDGLAWSAQLENQGWQPVTLCKAVRCHALHKCEVIVRWSRHCYALNKDVRVLYDFNIPSFRDNVHSSAKSHFYSWPMQLKIWQITVQIKILRTPTGFSACPYWLLDMPMNHSPLSTGRYPSWFQIGE